MASTERPNFDNPQKLLTQIFRILAVPEEELDQLTTESLHEINMSTAEKLYDQKGLDFDIPEKITEEEIFTKLSDQFTPEEIALASADVSFDYLSEVLSSLDLSEDQKSQLSNLLPKQNG
jgi:hypothetical protein